MSLSANLKLSRAKGCVVVAASLSIALGGFILYQPSFDFITSSPAAEFTASPPIQIIPPVVPTAPTSATAVSLDASQLSSSFITDLLQYFQDYPISAPYKDHFGELGRRTRILRDILAVADRDDASTHQEELFYAANTAAVQLFPFLKQLPSHPNSQTPLTDIRSSFVPDSAGIVISVGDKNIRYAGHLLVCLLHVVGTRLPIQIFYAGDDDLSKDNRDFLTSLVNAAPGKFSRSPATAPIIEFVNVLSIFDDTTLKLKEGGWAIKPFAALSSTFERVVLLDADAVFLKSPDLLLEQTAFQQTGALLFHDRLLWQHSYPERHEWYHSQIKRPSKTLQQSKVWTEEYAEEADSGVVVIDKRRTDVFMALLHICWQNSYDVREEVTYKLTYGDKETWWMGFEMAGATYEMERHYGAILGWEEDFFAENSRLARNGQDDFLPELKNLVRDGDQEEQDQPEEVQGTNNSPSKKICSFVIAHLDQHDELFWFNGGLLKNKKVPEMTHDFMEPGALKWAVDGKWEKGADRLVGSCMQDTETHELSATEVTILTDSVQEAQNVDVLLNI